MLVFSNSMCGAATIRERRLFYFRRCGDYSRAASDRANTVNATTFASNCSMGCVLALYGSTMQSRCTMWFFRALFFCLVCRLA